MNDLLNPNIQLVEPGHKYVLSDNPEIKFRSVTEIVGEFFEPFDNNAVAEKLVASHPKYRMMTVKDVISMWDAKRDFGTKILNYVKSDVDIDTVWKSMGYTTGNGRDMTSVMHRMSGPPIHEQTLGSADAMLLRLLDGDETMGGTKKPYDPRIHFVLIRDAYLDANPNNIELKNWLDNILNLSLIHI